MRRVVSHLLPFAGGEIFQIENLLFVIKPCVPLVQDIDEIGVRKNPGGEVQLFSAPPAH
jgi:hypothetical protein